MRAVYLVGAAVSLLLGLLGAFLPVLPTTPFVLLCAYCLSRSHPGWHSRLRRSASFGPLIRDWEDRGAVSVRAKTTATAVMAVLAALACAREGPPWAAKAAVVAVEGVVLAFIWTRPSRP